MKTKSGLRKEGLTFLSDYKKFVKDIERYHRIRRAINTLYPI